MVIEYKGYACNNNDEVTKEFNDHLWKTKLLDSVLIAFRLKTQWSRENIAYHSYNAYHEFRTHLSIEKRKQKS